MFKIRRIYDDSRPCDKLVIEQVQAMMRSQFSLLSDDEIAALPLQLKNTSHYHFRPMLFVSDDLKGHINGFAFMFYVSDITFCYLDFISAAKYMTGRGIGSALYKKVREESLALKATGLFFECLPDIPSLCKDPKTLKENASRLRFYEKFGARPIINTKYETPLTSGDDNPPFLIYDDLGCGIPLSVDRAKVVVRSILERRHSRICSKEYVEMVVNSFVDNPVRLREPRYNKIKASIASVVKGKISSVNEKKQD